MKGYIFGIKDREVLDVLEGKKEFIMESACSLLDNGEDVGLAFDDEYLTITTDTNYINEDAE